ncbi:hypothetical protein ABPG75_008422 [Micractinium tetrahymenae]
MPKKKSLADELADLFNPAPTKEFDPEADVFGQGPALEESDDELAAAQPRKGREAARLRGEIVMEGREYAGRRSSRAALFGGEEGSGEEDEEDEDEEQEGGSGSGSEDEEGAEEDQPHANGKLGAGISSGEEEDDEDGMSSGEEEEEEGDAGWLGGEAAGSSSDDEPPEAAAAGSGGAGRRATRLPAAAADGELPSGSEDGGEGSEEEEGRGGGAAATAAAAAEDEMAALEREYEAMQQDEQADMAGLKERAARERRKALAVQAQKAVWQRGLESRILLQRALVGANRLPQGEMAAVTAGSAPDMAAAFAGLAADAAALAGELLQLLGALAEQNPAVGEASAAAGVQPPSAAAAAAASGQHAAEQQGGQPPASDALWPQIEASYAGFAAFRDASIDRWHRKTMLTTGGAALRGGQLKALNQSVSTQVAQLLQDSGKVVQRMRLPRTAQQQPQHRVLCPDPDAPAAKRRRVDEDEDAEREANGLEDDRDPETFDDTEFYQTLLREFLEGSDAGGANWHLGPKQRKAVDRRASKGRKLRYHVHDKLVNFMAPVELAAPQFAAQLFSNLFGGGSGGGARA